MTTTITKISITFVLSGLGILAALPVFAEINLICENPRREYLVIYEEGDRYIQVKAEGSTSEYTVLAVEKTDETFIVAAQTPNGGPSVKMNLKPYLRMEYWVDGQLFQTDACRKP